MELQLGRSGQLDVLVDGEVVVSKQGPTFPDPEDAVAAVEAKLGA